MRDGQDLCLLLKGIALAYVQHRMRKLVQHRLEASNKTLRHPAQAPLDLLVSHVISAGFG